VHDLVEVLGLVPAAKREPARQPAIEDNAKGPDVGPSVEAISFSADLFRRHVRERASDFAPSHALDFFVDGKAEIANARVAMGVDENVGRFQVAMHQTRDVGIVDSVGHFDDDLGQVLKWWRIV
jgi:hypothetical protein